MDVSKNTRLGSTDAVAARRLIFEVAQALVLDVDTLTVNVVDNDGLRTIQVRTDADGVGRLVGSQGRTVRAIRTILTAFAAKGELIYSLDIAEAGDKARLSSQAS